MLDERIPQPSGIAGDDDIALELAFLLAALERQVMPVERAALGDGALLEEAFADLIPRERFQRMGPVLARAAVAGLASFPAVLAPAPAFAGEALPLNMMLAMAERPKSAPAMGATAVQFLPFSRPMQTVRAQVSAAPEGLPAPVKVKLPLNPRVKALFAESRQVVVTTKRLHAATFYHVVKGDSLYAIAERTLGSGARWRELYRANEGKIASTYTLRPGTRLVVPTLRQVAPTIAARATRALDQGAPAPHAYRVASGDNLYVIASKRLGDAKRWREIMALNKAMLNGKTMIYPNQWLVLPHLS